MQNSVFFYIYYFKGFLSQIIRILSFYPNNFIKLSAVFDIYLHIKIILWEY